MNKPKADIEPPAWRSCWRRLFCRANPENRERPSEFPAASRKRPVSLVGSGIRGKLAQIFLGEIVALFCCLVKHLPPKCLVLLCAFAFIHGDPEPAERINVAFLGALLPKKNRLVVALRHALAVPVQNAEAHLTEVAAVRWPP